MNCKPGDLAIYVGIHPQLLGVVVRCVRFLGEQRVAKTGEYLPMWQVDRPIPQSPAGCKDWIADKALRPIRPGDISDEEVRDLYLPKVPEAA